MSVIQFTVQFDVLANRAFDSTDAGSDADTIPLVGEIVFSPRFADERLALASTLLPRPAGVKLRPFTGFVDTDGQLKTSRGGTVGVRLYANDPKFGFTDPLLYQVSFFLRTAAGQPVKIDDGYFTAPSTDSVVQLASVLQPTMPLAVRAPELIGGSFNEAGQIVFENADGTVLEEITIPEGYLVFVDNGDLTWSVG